MAERKERVQFLDAESNELYECFLSPEDARRVSADMIFAQHVFNGLIREKLTKRNSNESETSPAHEATADNTDNTVREGITWTHEQTLLLITTYRQEYSKMGKLLLRKLWQLVAEKMKENGHNIPATKCATKMDTLKRQYKKVLDHNKQSSNDLMTYKYFDELDEIFRKQPWVKPVAIASSELQDKTFENIDERNSSSDAGSKRKRILEDILEERKNKGAKTEEYRNEKLGLMKELIEILKKKQ